MADLDYAYFLNRFRQMETTELIRNALERDLTSTASAALRTVLDERGIEGDRLERAVLDTRQAALLASSATNQCDYCGKGVALGALRKDHQKFCSQKCRRESRLHLKALELAPDLIEEHALRIIAGPCPQCRQVGQLVEMRPIDSCFSLLVVCFPARSTALRCRRCAVRSAAVASIGTFLFGWWSLPGLFVTPIAIWRNIRLMLKDRFDDLPTPALRHHAALDLADRFDDSMDDTSSTADGWHKPVIRAKA